MRIELCAEENEQQGIAIMSGMLSESASLRDSVEAFAGLCADLDDPFADEGNALGRVGLDGASFAALRQHWVEKLGRSDAVLTSAFARAYAARTAEVRSTRCDSAGKVRFGDSASETPLKAPPAPRGFNPVDETSYGMRVLVPALPFAHEAPAASSAPSAVVSKPSAPASAAPLPPQHAPIATTGASPRRAAEADLLDATAPLGTILRDDPTFPFMPRPDMRPATATAEPGAPSDPKPKKV